MKKSITQRLGFACWECENENGHMYPIKGLGTKESSQVFLCYKCEIKRQRKVKPKVGQLSLFIKNENR